MKRSSDAEVIIVGGGIAGLSCAVELAQQGRRVTVVERADALGGRAGSWVDEKTQDPVHLGPHIFLSEYPNLWKLLDALGTRGRIVWQDASRTITVVRGREEFVAERWPLPAPLHVAPAMLADASMSLWDKLSTVPFTTFALQCKEDELLALDQRTGRELLEELGVSAGAIDTFFAFISLSILNVSVEQVSAAALVRFYRKLIGRQKVQIGFPDCGLGELFAPARAVLEARGSTVLLGATVKRLLGAGDVVDGVELADGRTLRAPQVVLAMPAQAVRPLMRRPWLARYTALRRLDAFVPCPYLSTYLWFDRKLTKKAFWARDNARTDLNCDFYDFSNINRGWEQRPSLIGSNCILSSRFGPLTDAEVVRRTLEELSEYLPEAKQAKLMHSVVSRVPMAIHQPLPGTEALRPGPRAGPQGLFLSGDWLDTRVPASMESAALAGLLTAEALLGSKGLAVRHEDVDFSARLLGRLWHVAPALHVPRAAHRAKKLARAARELAGALWTVGRSTP